MMYATTNYPDAIACASRDILVPKNSETMINNKNTSYSGTVREPNGMVRRGGLFFIRAMKARGLNTCQWRRPTPRFRSPLVAMCDLAILVSVRQHDTCTRVLYGGSAPKFYIMY